MLADPDHDPQYYRATNIFPIPKFLTPNGSFYIFIPVERLKTEDEKLKEEKEKLERLEADRLRRMRGETEEAARGAGVSVEDMQVGYRLCRMRGNGKEVNRGDAVHVGDVCTGTVQAA